jgi:uncharacterized protein
MNKILIFLPFILFSTSIFACADSKGAIKNHFKSCQDLAEQGDQHAQHKLGAMYRSGRHVMQNDKLAVEWFHKSAEQGHAPAQHQLAELYDFGHGVLQDYAAAEKWYRKSAEQGNADAKFKLGLLYHQGRGVEKNDKTAAKLFKQAANQGQADSQYYLALMYQSGFGLLQDHVLAHVWANIATSNGNEKARLLREQLVLSMGRSEIENAQTKARNWVDSFEKK